MKSFSLTDESNRSFFLFLNHDDKLDIYCWIDFLLTSETRNMSFAFGEGSINNDILHGEARPDFQIDKSSQIRKSKSVPIIESNLENR